MSNGRIKYNLRLFQCRFNCKTIFATSIHTKSKNIFYPSKHIDGFKHISIPAFDMFEWWLATVQYWRRAKNTLSDDFVGCGFPIIMFMVTSLLAVERVEPKWAIDICWRTLGHSVHPALHVQFLRFKHHQKSLFFSYLSLNIDVPFP